MMKKYILPVIYQVVGKTTVEAESLEEAKRMILFEQITPEDLGDNTFVDNTLEIRMNSIEYDDLVIEEYNLEEGDVIEELSDDIFFLENAKDTNALKTLYELIGYDFNSDYTLDPKKVILNTEDATRIIGLLCEIDEGYRNLWLNYGPASDSSDIVPVGHVLLKKDWIKKDER